MGLVSFCWLVTSHWFIKSNEISICWWLNSFPSWITGGWSVEFIKYTVLIYIYNIYIYICTYIYIHIYTYIYTHEYDIPIISPFRSHNDNIFRRRSEPLGAPTLDSLSPSTSRNIAAGRSSFSSETKKGMIRNSSKFWGYRIEIATIYQLYCIMMFRFIKWYLQVLIFTFDLRNIIIQYSWW